MSASNSLIQPLPDGGLDIVGDIHGEIEPLTALLRHLGYDLERGLRPVGRTLVFVGDLVDRGPDSPSVLRLVQQLCAAGMARAILGNHEINLLAGLAKDGSGWFFDERLGSDVHKYPPFARSAQPEQRQQVAEFLHTLPLALERADVRVVHSAWLGWAVQAVRALRVGDAAHAWVRWEHEAAAHAQQLHISERVQAERASWPHSLEDAQHRPPFLPAHCENELLKSRINPIKVLTSGLEQRADAPFFAGNKWRFIARLPWWNDYTDDAAVVVGHYWRSPSAQAPSISSHEGLFNGITPLAWHGVRANVFCVDYSVGARAQARKAQRSTTHMRLAALRWPERELVFDDGSTHATTGFMQGST